MKRRKAMNEELIEESLKLIEHEVLGWTVFVPLLYDSRPAEHLVFD